MKHIGDQISNSAKAGNNVLSNAFINGGMLRNVSAYIYVMFLDDIYYVIQKLSKDIVEDDYIIE